MHLSGGHRGVKINQWKKAEAEKDPKRAAASEQGPTSKKQRTCLKG